jgi:hypothetical protein
MLSIYTSSAFLPLGSYEFTPEGYANASSWKPEDGYSWDDFCRERFGQGRSNSIEQAEAALAEYEKQAESKIQITDSFYAKRSLRQLLPDRWLVAYTKDKAGKEVNGKRTRLYSRLKQTMLFKSIVLGYGQGRIAKRLPNKEAAKYIKEHCASSARLKALALRAYEAIGNISGYGTWTPVSPPIFLCLAAAKSSLDAMSAVLWALLFQETPAGNDTPDMGRLLKKTRSTGVFEKEFARLHQSSWYKRLQQARNKVIHRSAAPVVHDRFGAAFEYDLGMFKEGRLNTIWVEKPRIGMRKDIARIQLDKIVKGFVVGLEKWEKSVSRKLAKLAWHQSHNPDGIMMGLEFNDHNLLRDGEGPSLMLTSYDPTDGSVNS